MIDTTIVADAYDYWRAKLASPSARIPVKQGFPQAGFYKMRYGKDEPYIPVAFWFDGDEVCCQVGSDQITDRKRMIDTWTSACRHAVSHEDYTAAVETGVWPTAAPVAVAPVAEAPVAVDVEFEAEVVTKTAVVDATPAAGIGHNTPPVQDVAAMLLQEIETEHARVKAWVEDPKRGGERDCHAAANWLPEIRKLEKRALDAFEAEKKPIRELADAVDEKWRPIKAAALKTKQTLDAKYQAMARAEQDRLQQIARNKAIAEAAERQRIADAERAKRLEQDRLDAEARKAAAGEDEQIPMFDNPPEPEPAPEPVVVIVPEVKVSFGGATASKIAPRKAKPVAVVVDYKAAAVALVDANNPDVKAAIDKAAAKIIGAGGSLAGVKVQQ